jgi:hypothetical protein
MVVVPVYERDIKFPRIKPLDEIQPGKTAADYNYFPGLSLFICHK